MHIYVLSKNKVKLGGLEFLSRIIHLVRKVIISGVIYILYLGPLHLKKKYPKVDYKSTASYNDS